MKTLWHNLFGPNKKAEVKPHLLPGSGSVYSLYEHHKRALIGWIAGRIGQIVGVSFGSNAALLYSARYVPDHDRGSDSEQDYLIYLATCLFLWLEDGVDIHLKLRDLNLGPKYYDSLLTVYEEIQGDVYLFRSQSRSRTRSEGSMDAVWQVYRDVIYAATQQKFLLIESGEVGCYMQGSVLCQAAIKERSDIPKARDRAKQSLLDAGLPLSKVMNQILLVSEAITNVLKHAEEGLLTVVKTPSAVHVCVEDSGPGFELKMLPYATLLAGYSTKNSLGQGFTLMMKMADQMLLCTSPKGSTIILIFHEEGVKLESTV